ncbi:hypothetical protein GCM10011349_47040 [Novosphingobium indicum]|uniref:ABC transmembrane type-1 domain-containing protein n=1 Tax=Novosphingobium indicum TaxID=462949 RepID=A0ABQ2K2B8_9SPHN|nr:hypothetical protein GCM10011349_47040 [Novosphingobium indicum]
MAALSVLWLARTKKSQLALITVFLIPYAIPASVIGLAFRFAIGPQSAWAQFTSPLLGVPPNFWLYQHAFEAAVLASTWQFFPFAFLLSYLGLRTTPRAVLQAAQMDGAPFTRTTLMVVLARILPVIMAIFALRLAFMLVKFDTPFVFTEMIASGDDVATIELWRTIAGSTSPELNIIAWCLQITSFLLSLGYLAARREGAD